VQGSVEPASIKGVEGKWGRFHKQDYNLHFLFPEKKVPKGMAGELGRSHRSGWLSMEWIGKSLNWHFI
jgi:hypothetical protein